MAEQRQPDNNLQLILSSVKSTGLWSFVAAIVGIVAIIAGGALIFTVGELKDFATSVLIIGIVLLFLALVLSPRAIAIFLVGRQGRFGSNIIIMTVAFFAIAILVNLMLFLNPTRVDVTATRVFTLSEQTKQILGNLDTEIQANAFFIPNDQNTANARRQAEDLLNEFKRQSPNFSYRFIDPELERNQANRYGVNSYPAVVFEDANRGVLQGTLRFTEGEFLTSVLIVTGTDQKTIYVLTGHGEAAVTRDIVTNAIDDNGFDQAIAGLQRDNYRVQPLNLKQEGAVPDDTAVLVIAGPQGEIDREEQQALFQYIISGGRIIALFDPSTPNSFVDLLILWGVTLGQDSIVDNVSNIAGEQFTPLLQKANGQYLTSASPNTGDIPIADLIDVTFFPDATSIDPLLAPEDMPPFIRLVPLAMTTPASWLETDIENISRSFEDRGGPFALVTVIEARGTIDERTPHPLAKFVIIGDSDFAKNKFFSSNNNGDLFLNSVNWLADDIDLISIHPKLFPIRDLNHLTTRERNFMKWSSWVFPPGVMLILGMVAWWRRR